MVDHLGELRPPRLGDIGKDPRLGHRAEMALDRRPPARRNEIETDRTRENIAVRDTAHDAGRRDAAIVIFGNNPALRVDAHRVALCEQPSLLITMDLQTKVQPPLYRLRKPRLPRHSAD